MWLGPGASFPFGTVCFITTPKSARHWLKHQTFTLPKRCALMPRACLFKEPEHHPAASPPRSIFGHRLRKTGTQPEATAPKKPKKQKPQLHSGGLCLQDLHLLYFVFRSSTARPLTIRHSWSTGRVLSMLYVLRKNGYRDRSGSRFRLRYEFDQTLMPGQSSSGFFSDLLLDNQENNPIIISPLIDSNGRIFSGHFS